MGGADQPRDGRRGIGARGGGWGVIQGRGVLHEKVPLSNGHENCSDFGVLASQTAKPLSTMSGVWTFRFHKVEYLEYVNLAWEIVERMLDPGMIITLLAFICCVFICVFVLYFSLLFFSFRENIERLKYIFNQAFFGRVGADKAIDFAYFTHYFSHAYKYFILTSIYMIIKQNPKCSSF